MQHHSTERTSCSSCSVTSCHIKNQEVPDRDTLQGGQFVATSAGVFLIPIFCAVIGSSFFADNGTVQFFVGLGGLLGGMLITIVSGRVIAARKENKS